MAEYLLGTSALEWTEKSTTELIEKHTELSWVFEDKRPDHLKCWEALNCTNQSCPLLNKEFTDCWTLKNCPHCDFSNKEAEETKSSQGRCSQCRIYNSYLFCREKEFTRSPNEKILLQVQTSPLCNEEGNVIGKIRIFRDVTQDRELGRLKDNFLSVLSHELRSPLTSIRSYAEILLHYEDTDQETQNEFLQIILSESNRLDQMIEDVMELQHLESSRSIWKNEEVSLPEVVNGIFDDYQRTLERKNITCKIDMDLKSPKIWTDSDKIHHVINTIFRNLMNNTPNNGTIFLKTLPMKGQRKTDQDYFIKFTLSNVSSFLHDSRNAADQADDPDAAVEETDMELKKGLGLGFTICKRILDQYGGNLWMENGTDTQGITFHFTFPSSTPLDGAVFEEEVTQETPDEEVRPTIEKAKKRILIVDDDPQLLNALTFALKKEGYRVHSTTSSLRALEMVFETRPDLIISDIRMPELDGYAFFQQVQENESTKMIPFIFISAKKKVGDLIRGFKTGVDDYLVKPFDIKELAARVEALLGRVEQYQDLSRLDNLTGALTRQTLEENLNREIRKAHRERMVPLSLVMADLDHFKRINDTHGHLAGDFLLKSFVNFLKKNLRDEDFLGRYGGEEFCIIMPDVPKQTARDIIERLLKQLSETTFHYEKENIDISLTCSFGISGFPEDGASAEGLIKKSDEAMYAAKNMGRNKVSLFGERKKVNAG